MNRPLGCRGAREGRRLDGEAEQGPAAAAMAFRNGLLVTVLAAVAVSGAAPAAPAGGWTWRLGADGLAKYNSNLTLLSADGPIRPKDAWLTELGARLHAARTSAAWRLDGQLSGMANVHADHAEEDWFFTRGRLGLRRPVGTGTAELSAEARYYTVPVRDTFDFFRNVALLTWRRPVSGRWQLRTGYESILTTYPQSRQFDYTVHGLLLELRTRWTLDLTTYYLLDLQTYRGTATPQDAEAEASPRDGQRAMVRVGFDGLFGGRHALSGTYSLQADEADLGVQQIGDIEGGEDSQDSQAEFDLVKHKATLLYSVPVTGRLLLSSYAEWIHKGFDTEERLKQQLPRRTDTLFLTSTYLRCRLDERFSVKLRDLRRGNRSSVDLLEYDNHILSVGLDLRL